LVVLFYRWWKKLDFVTKVPYARDRVVEAYFWQLVLSYEPRNSTARKLGTKLTKCVSVLDDTYDAFATVEELELFTDAIQRLIDFNPKEIVLKFFIISFLN
jgi:hypothetical protein